MTLFSDDPPREGGGRAALVGQALIVLAVLATLVLAISPTPYVVERPGPVYDTLGETSVEGESVPVIEIAGAETFATEGRLDLLTVFLDGSRERPLDWFEVIGAWFDPTRAILPLDAVYPDGQTRDEAEVERAEQMRQSQEAAVAAALIELGIDVGATVRVAAVTDGSPAAGLLEDDDELLTADGIPLASDGALRAHIADAGVGTPIEFGIRRDGATQNVTIVPVARSASDASAMIGVVPAVDYDFPFDVDIRLQDVGGPSAGMIFSLAIYDKLTPGSLTGGEHIAGTGTIDADGAVGAIGGIRQKLHGARDAGAEWFLAPVTNCDAVVGHVPDGLRVFAVSTLDDALDVVTAIGTGTSTEQFPGCEP